MKKINEYLTAILETQINRLLLLVSVIFSLTLSSCNNNILDNSNSKIEKGDVAIEIFSHIQSANRTEFINKNKHSDFISDKVLSLVSSNKQAMMRLNKIGANEIDTIVSLEEIPIYKETITATKIYSSGIMESEIQDVTPDDMNPINSFTANPLPIESTIKKTIIEGGMIKSYSGIGELIHSESYVGQNMKQFLDTVKYYVALSEESQEKKQMNSESQLNKIKKQKMPAGAKIIELSNGNVVLEQFIETNKNTASFSIKGSSERLRTRTELNPEMTKTIKFEILQGEQLFERRTYFYSENKLLKNSKYAVNLPNENPEVVKSEVLVFNRQGVPMIKTTQERYLRNQMIFHF